MACRGRAQALDRPADIVGGYATVTGMASTEPDTPSDLHPEGVAPKAGGTTPTEARLAALGVWIPDVLLPADGVALETWAVVACDQFTSQPDYWSAVEATVGDAPSTLRLVLPEVYLGRTDTEDRIAGINTAMADYLGSGLFTTLPDTLVLVRRTTGTGTIRWGLVIALDLDHYDWSPDSRTLIRATEGTIPERVAQRAAIRRGAVLEVPHTMVLLSDPGRTVIEPLAQRYAATAPLYDVTLMAGGGQVTGWAISDPADHDGLADALGALRDDLDPANPVLFVMGDGNHSFASAKQRWDDVKPSVPEPERATHPARYSLVELENVHDPGLTFEPIHRVLFGISHERVAQALATHTQSYAAAPVPDAVVATQVLESEDAAAGPRFGVVDPDGTWVVTASGGAELAVAIVQAIVDDLVAEGIEVDYIHGADVAADLGSQPGNLALLLASLDKDLLFTHIAEHGALPRKAFSLGEAPDKRYYLEARDLRR